MLAEDERDGGARAGVECRRGASGTFGLDLCISSLRLRRGGESCILASVRGQSSPAAEDELRGILLLRELLSPSTGSSFAIRSLVSLETAAFEGCGVFREVIIVCSNGELSGRGCT